jgi:hypothetical protein
MRNRETRFTGKETVESQSEKKSSSKPQESNSTLYDRAKKGIGIAYAGVLKAAETTIKGATAAMAVQAFSGLGGAHALSTSDAPSTALVSPDSGSRDGNNGTALHLDQKGLSHLSNQTHLERSLGKVTPGQLKQMGVKNPERFMRNVQKLEHNLQQRGQRQKVRQEMRRILEEAKKNPEVLESLRDLFKESSEIHRRKLDTPCLQDSFPKSYVRGEVLEVEGGGTVLQVLSDLGTTNICSDPVSSVQFGRIISYTCPPDCTPSTGGSGSESTPKESFVEGVPSTIAQYATSKGSATDQIYCLQTDSNGRKTPIAPSSTLYIVWPQGIQKGSTIRGKSIPYNPPRS